VRVRLVATMRNVDCAGNGDDRERIGRVTRGSVINRGSVDGGLTEAVPTVRFTIARYQRITAALNVDTVKN